MTTAPSIHPNLGSEDRFAGANVEVMNPPRVVALKTAFMAIYAAKVRPRLGTFHTAFCAKWGHYKVAGENKWSQVWLGMGLAVTTNRRFLAYVLLSGAVPYDSGAALLFLG